jgi:hypothetical protein
VHKLHVLSTSGYMCQAVTPALGDDYHCYLDQITLYLWVDRVARIVSERMQTKRAVLVF